MRKALQVSLGLCFLLLIKARGVNVDKSVRFLGLPIIDIRHGGRLSIGANVRFISSSRDTALGVNHPCIIRLLSGYAFVEIHESTGISGATICCQERITIGKQCLVGANVIIADTDFHPILPENRRFSKEGIRSGPIVIEDNVFLGTGSIILKNVTIGENTVVAAGSVVVDSLPPNCVAGGNPAKVIRYFCSS